MEWVGKFTMMLTPKIEMQQICKSIPDRGQVPPISKACLTGEEDGEVMVQEGRKTFQYSGSMV
jgi:hypothetical protein